MEPHCWCGKLAILRTSWTDANPGRRFWGCVNYMGDRTKACNFHTWMDPPMCQRSRCIIPGLLRKIEKLEEDEKNLKDVVAQLQNKNGRCRMMMFFLFVVLAVVLLMSFDGEEVKKGVYELPHGDYKI